MLRLGLVGCGGMGCRHIGGLKKLRSIGDRSWDLVAACDVLPANAGRAAGLAVPSGLRWMSAAYCFRCT